MNILVLGSEGQIGKHLVAFLKNKNHNVVEYDIINGREQDVSDGIFFNTDALKNIDFVYFLAFDVGGSKYLKTYQNTFNFLHNNISLLKNVFEVLEESKIPFIFASSQMSNMTHSSYGAAKKIGELYTKILNGLVVKFWNVYGYEKDLNKSHVITDFILKAFKGNIDCITTGEEMRQFLYVEDCCEALYNLQNNFVILDKNREYHITSFVWNSIKDVAHIIQNIIPCNVEFGKITDTVQLDKKNQPDEYILEFWKPKTTLEEGIKQIYNIYKNDSK